MDLAVNIQLGFTTSLEMKTVALSYTKITIQDKYVQKVVQLFCPSCCLLRSKLKKNK